MKNQNVKGCFFGGIILLIGAGIFLPNFLVAQESTRRAMRGSGGADPAGGEVAPIDAGGAGQVGEDPARGEAGRPDPNGGAPEPVEPEIDDPFSRDPNGGAPAPEVG